MVRREFWPDASAQGRAQVPTARRLENVDQLLANGIRIGSPASRAAIVEFADFECPFCRRFHATYADLKRRFGDDLSLVFIHYPLGSHRFARPAARAAECAATRGRFGDYARLLYLKQDSLGLKSWGSFAFEAGIQDTLAFSRCAIDTVVVQRIENGLALGKGDWRTRNPHVDRERVDVLRATIASGAAGSDRGPTREIHARQVGHNTGDEVGEESPNFVAGAARGSGDSCG